MGILISDMLKLRGMAKIVGNHWCTEFNRPSQNKLTNQYYVYIYIYTNEHKMYLKISRKRKKIKPHKPVTR